MPELPEVEVVVKGLKSNILSLNIIDFWTDYEPYLQLPKNKQKFKKLILKKKILKIERKGKGILFNLSSNFYLFVQQKMTGIFILTSFQKPKEKFLKRIKKENKFVHLVLFLEKRKAILFSDPRKFGKFFLGDKKQILNLPFLKNLGANPFSFEFTFEKFLELLKKHNKKILKNFLMDQKVIAGIGNIYANEILWKAKLSPQRKAGTLSIRKAKDLYNAILFILKKAIKYQGSSISDFLNVYGEKGNYQNVFYVYSRTKEKCFRCQGRIKRVKINQRSTYFCSQCQK